jgi:hypothetical protein
MYVCKAGLMQVAFSSVPVTAMVALCNLQHGCVQLRLPVGTADCSQFLTDV